MNLRAAYVMFVLAGLLKKVRFAWHRTITTAAGEPNYAYVHIRA